MRGDVLRARREERQLSRAELGELSGLASKTIQRAEAGGPVTPAVARGLSLLLGLPLGDVLRPSHGESSARLLACGLAPAAPPPEWIARDEDLATALRHLGCPLDASCARGASDCPRMASKGAHVCVLAGPPGCGKTALAQVVVSLVAHRFPDGIVWIDGGHLASPDRLEAAQRDVGRALGFGAALPTPTASRRDLDQAFRHHFWSRSRLIVLDDVRSPLHLEPFLDAGRPTSLLVTTQSRSVAARADRSTVELRPLPEGMVRTALEAYVEPERLTRDASGAQKLIALVSGAPASVRVAGQLLRRETFTQPSELVRRAVDQALGADLASPDQTASDGWERSLVRAYDGLKARLSADAWQLWTVLSLLGARPVPLSWVDKLTALSHEASLRAFSELVDHFLVAVDHAGAPSTDGEPFMQLAWHAALAGEAALGTARASTLARIRHVVPRRA